MHLEARPDNHVLEIMFIYHYYSNYYYYDYGFARYVYKETYLLPGLF